MTSDALQKMRERVEAATPGPWVSDGSVVGWLSGMSPAVAVRYHNKERGSECPVCMCQPMRSGQFQTAGTERPVEDADFIAHARTDLPQLLDLVASQSAEIARLRGREDDAEPITEEWLRSVGAKDERKALWLGPAELCHFPSGDSFGVDLNGWHELKTRGDVRKLCEALGIQLKEQPHD